MPGLALAGFEPFLGVLEKGGRGWRVGGFGEVVDGMSCDAWEGKGGWGVRSTVLRISCEGAG